MGNGTRVGRASAGSERHSAFKLATILLVELQLEEHGRRHDGVRLSASNTRLPTARILRSIGDLDFLKFHEG